MWGYNPWPGKVELFHPTLITGRGAHLVIKIVLSGPKPWLEWLDPFGSVAIAHRFRIHAAIRFRHAVRKGRGLVIYERIFFLRKSADFLFMESNNWENSRIFCGALKLFFFL